MNQETKRAEWFYHHPDYGYNCAQAIAHCWTGDPDLVGIMKQCGSGRACEGHCGAIHAARIVASALNMNVPKLEEEFTQQAGSLKCMEIRRIRKLTCRQCVEMAHNILETLVREGQYQNTSL